MKKFFLKKIILKIFKISLSLLINLITLFLKLKKESYIFLREDRIGHQAGNADIEFYKAFYRKKYKNENTIFIFPFPKYKVSNLDLRERLISYASQKSYKTLVINYKYFNKES